MWWRQNQAEQSESESGGTQFQNIIGKSGKNRISTSFEQPGGIDTTGLITGEAARKITGRSPSLQRNRPGNRCDGELRALPESLSKANFSAHVKGSLRVPSRRPGRYQLRRGQIPE